MSESEMTPPPAKKLSLSRLVANLAAWARAHKRALAIAGGLVALFLIVSTATVATSNQPSFCLTCHEIRPAYDQWRTSSHKGVTCLNCHTEPGIAGYVKVNTAGAANVLTHLVADYRVPARADVHDASCLSCHPRESRPEASVRTTLRVAHSKHDKQQCADCHGRLVHVNPNGELSTAPKPHVVRDCTVCHTPENCPHGDATLACTSCHSGNIPKHEPARERGVMPRQSCQECHQKNKVGSPEYCQTCHVSPHGVSVPCSRCHTSQVTWTEHTFNHPVKLEGKHAGLDCAKCHGTKSLTGLKYVCSTCHTPPTAHKGTNDDCTKCHSPEGWKLVRLADHKFPQDHNGAGGNCAVCHLQGNTATVTCNTCHPQATMDDKHTAKGIAAVSAMCAKCHPTGAKPAAPTVALTATPAKSTVAPIVAPTSAPAATKPAAATAAPATSAPAATKPAAATAAPTTAVSTGPKPLPASHAGRTTCNMCHETGAIGPKSPADHAGRADATCVACHKPQ